MKTYKEASAELDRALIAFGRELRIELRKPRFWVFAVIALVALEVAILVPTLGLVLACVMMAVAVGLLVATY